MTTKNQTARVYIGTSGWNYPGWKDTFYAGVPKKDWLSFCAQQFDSVEVNATFYGLQKQTTFEHWREQTPPDFRFAIKGNRYLTHTKRLRDPDEPIGKEREHALGLREKLAVVIWQFPKNFQKNLQRLNDFLVALGAWSETRHAVEFRHTSWFDDEVAESLSQHRVAVCQSDAADWPMWERVTTDLVYIRLHGHTRTYASAYSLGLLQAWAQRIIKWRKEQREVHVYFDNDAEGAAPYDALRLRELISTL